MACEPSAMNMLRSDAGSLSRRLLQQRQLLLEDADGLALLQFFQLARAVFSALRALS